MLFCVEGGGVGGGEGYMCYYFFLAMGQRSEAYGRRRKALVAILSKRTGDYEEEGDGCGLRAISSSAEGCNPLGAYATGDVCVCVCVCKIIYNLEKPMRRARVTQETSNVDCDGGQAPKWSEMEL